MPINEDGDLSERAQTLVASVADLSERVDKLTKSNVALDRRGHRNRVLIVIAIVGLVLDLALSGLFVAQHIAQMHTNSRIKCQNDLRAAAAAIADKDRRNVDKFFADVITVKTPKQFALVYEHYKKVRDIDDTARAKLGNGNAGTCS